MTVLHHCQSVRNSVELYTQVKRIFITKMMETVIKFKDAQHNKYLKNKLKDISFQKINFY